MVLLPSSSYCRCLIGPPSTNPQAILARSDVWSTSPSHPIILRNESWSTIEMIEEISVQHGNFRPSVHDKVHEIKFNTLETIILLRHTNPFSFTSREDVYSNFILLYGRIKLVKKQKISAFSNVTYSLPPLQLLDGHQTETKWPILL